MIEEIKMAVQAATSSNQKLAMFHFQVLKHARELEGFQAKAFCADVGVPLSYATEFNQMMSLARIIREQGARLEFSA